MKRVKSFCFALAAVIGMAGSLHAATDDLATTDPAQAIQQHPGFREGLFWLGTNAPSQSESTQLWLILQDLNQPIWTEEVETFLQQHPDSPWAASLHYAYASYNHRTGRTTKALIHWEGAWELVKGDTTPQGRRLGSEI